MWEDASMTDWLIGNRGVARCATSLPLPVYIGLTDR